MVHPHFSEDTDASEAPVLAAHIIDPVLAGAEAAREVVIMANEAEALAAEAARVAQREEARVEVRAAEKAAKALEVSRMEE
jgi:hypothetical protein